MTRGRPRGQLSSPISLMLLIILRETPCDSATIGFFLGLPSRTVSRYLCSLRSMGYVEHDGLFWRLTDKGLLYITKRSQAIHKLVSKLETFGYKKLHLTTENYRNTKEITNSDKTSLASLEPVIRYFEGSEVSSLNIIISKIEERIGRELTEVEYAIIRFLYMKSRQLQRKYLWPPEYGLSLAEWLAEETGYPSHLVSDALRELESHGIVFLTQDRRRGVPKIRLDRSVGG